MADVKQTAAGSFLARITPNPGGNWGIRVVLANSTGYVLIDNSELYDLLGEDTYGYTWTRDRERAEEKARKMIKRLEKARENALREGTEVRGE